MDSHTRLEEPTLFINEAAIRHNISVIRGQMRPSTKLCAVVKADAYGHGASAVAAALSRPGKGSAGTNADCFAVATLEEAFAIGPTALPTIIFRPVEQQLLGQQSAELLTAIDRGWTLTVTSPAALRDLSKIAGRATRDARVHVLVDTGMSRCGVAPGKLSDLVQTIEQLPHLVLESVSTHFACSEVVGHGFTQHQLERFRSVAEHLRYSPSGPVLLHAANSGAIFNHPESHLDLVRPGIAIYGIDPTGTPRKDRELRPAMRWEAPAIAIHTLETGESVGYGQTWRAPVPTRIAVLPIGYADGYPRTLSGKSAVKHGDRLCQVIGRVSMDMTCVDLTTAPDAKVGDSFVVMDDDPLSPISAYALAELMDTIPYEVIARIGSRVRKQMVSRKIAAADAATAAADKDGQQSNSTAFNNQLGLLDEDVA